MKITIQDIFDCRPCYSRDRIQELAGGRTEWTPRELLTRDDVPVDDRVWLGCHLLARRDRGACVRFAEGCASRARAYAAAKDAHAAARYAALAAAARYAAHAAAASASAAWCAARYADAWYAAAAAYARDAEAAKAERQRQIRDLIRHLEEATS